MIRPKHYTFHEIVLPFDQFSFIHYWPDCRGTGHIACPLTIFLHQRHKFLLIWGLICRHSSILPTDLFHLHFTTIQARPLYEAYVLGSVSVLTKDSHNTGNFMPYSFRIVCGFFNVPHCTNKHGRYLRDGTYGL